MQDFEPQIQSVEGAIIGGYDPGAWKTVTREGVDVDTLTLVTDTDARMPSGARRRPRPGRTRPGISSTAPGTTSRPPASPTMRARSRPRSRACPRRASIRTRCASSAWARCSASARAAQRAAVVVLRYEPRPRSPATRARSRRQGGDVRLGRHLAQAGRRTWRT